MEFVHEFAVPAGVERTWETLTDLERVAPCLPGALLEEVDGGNYRGRVKVKVGPITISYRGTATLAEADAEVRRARIHATGQEIRGGGTALANIDAELTETAEGTLVQVTTDLDVTGKPAQFGRGLMAEAGGRIIDTFAQRLKDVVLEQEPVRDEPAGGKQPSADPSPGDTTGGASRPASAEPPHMDGGTLDLVAAARPAATKRLAPIVGAFILVVLLTRRIRDR